MSLRNSLKHRNKIFGGWTSIGHPQTAEMLVKSGVDFLGIDIEHSTINQEQSQLIISTSHAAGIPCLPRVATHNPEAIKRLLDSGADGVIVPNVETTNQVENLIKWIKYPPLGVRGFGIARAQGYGHNFKEYITEWNNSSILIIQIESIKAIENIDKLLQYNEVDGIMLGPYDISGSLGIPGQINHEKVLTACQVVVNACNKHGKACCTHDINPTLGSVKSSLDSGYTFVVLASDVFILWKWGERMQEIIKSSR